MEVEFNSGALYYLFILAFDNFYGSSYKNDFYYKKRNHESKD